MYASFEIRDEKQKEEVALLQSLEDQFLREHQEEKYLDLFGSWLAEKYPELAKKYRIGVLGSINLKETAPVKKPRSKRQSNLPSPPPEPGFP